MFVKYTVQACTLAQFDTPLFSPLRERALKNARRALKQSEGIKYPFSEVEHLAAEEGFLFDSKTGLVVSTNSKDLIDHAFQEHQRESEEAQDSMGGCGC